ncbi:MAG: Uma2 family endonuclease [Planctomycetales bacterium]|nr:Uma2 family endonuclease [Planctomycetales bacterium]
MSTVIPRKRYTVTDYYRMVPAGIIHRDERVELLDGEVRVMSPIGSWHSGVVSRLQSMLAEALRRTAIITIQSPVRLGDYDEPEPDIAVLRPCDDFYTRSHPTPADVLLIIEVADTSLDYDRDEKLPRYAAAGVPEVWLVDIAAEAIEKFCELRDGIYQVQHVATGAEQVRPQLLPQFCVTAAELFA